MAGKGKGIWVKTVSKNGQTKTRFLNNRDKGGLSHGDTITLAEYNKAKEGKSLATQAVSDLKNVPLSPSKVPTQSTIESKPVAQKTTLYYALKVNENKIAYDEFESGIALDKNGNILLYKIGTKNAVAFTPQDLQKLEGAILTHNHPAKSAADSFGLNVKDPVQKQLHGEIVKAANDIGMSFSVEDISLLSVRKMNEIRAVTPNYTYSMKAPKSGWDSLDWEKQIVPSIEKHLTRLNGLLAKGFSDGTIANKGEAAVKLNHFLWKAVAQDTGMEYTVEKNVRPKPK